MPEVVGFSQVFSESVRRHHLVAIDSSWSYA